jgi:hypothetical protein
MKRKVRFLRLIHLQFYEWYFYSIYIRLLDNSLMHLEANLHQKHLSLIIDIKSKAMLLRSRLKERWKLLLLLGAIWILIIFPIPFLPAWGYPIDETSLRALITITVIVSIPFTLLAIFMNDGNGER